MRYGLQFAEGNPFPQDTEVGIQLQDEDAPVIVVPEPCPECPECPPGCEVACYGWVYAIAQSGGSGGFASGFAAAPGPIFLGIDDRSTGGIMTLVPAGEFCGHNLRFIVTGEDGLTEGTHYTVATISGGGFNWGVAISSNPSLFFGDYTVQAQIDLTDDETWTDTCPLVTVFMGPGG